MNELIERDHILPPAPLLPVQRVGTAHATAVAVQIPRRLPDVLRRLEEEAALAGEDFYYGWGAGKDKIEGASVKLAMAAVRCFGNSAVEMMPIQELPDSWVFTAVFVDLETGFTLSRQFRQSKGWKVFGKHDAERKDDIRFQIGQSKAVRNVVLNALPVSLIDRAMEKAKEGVKVRLQQYINDKGLPAATDLVFRALAKQGVVEQRVLDRLGIAAKTAVEIDHLVMLRGDLAALEKGQERADALFPQTLEAATAAKQKELGERIAAKKEKEAVRQEQDRNAEAPDAPHADDFNGGPEPRVEAGGE